MSTRLRIVFRDLSSGRVYFGGNALTRLRAWLVDDAKRHIPKGLEGEVRFLKAKLRKKSTLEIAKMGCDLLKRYEKDQPFAILVFREPRKIKRRRSRFFESVPRRQRLGAGGEVPILQHVPRLRPEQPQAQLIPPDLQEQFNRELQRVVREQQDRQLLLAQDPWEVANG